MPAARRSHATVSTVALLALRERETDRQTETGTERGRKEGREGGREGERECVRERAAVCTGALLVLLE